MKDFSDFLNEETESKRNRASLLMTFQEVVDDNDRLEVSKKFQYQEIDEEFFFEFNHGMDQYRVFYDSINDTIVLVSLDTGDEIEFENAKKFRNWIISIT